MDAYDGYLTNKQFNHARDELKRKDVSQVAVAALLGLSPSLVSFALMGAQSARGYDIYSAIMNWPEVD